MRFYIAKIISYHKKGQVLNCAELSQLCRYCNSIDYRHAISRIFNN